MKKPNKFQHLLAFALYSAVHNYLMYPHRITKDCRLLFINFYEDHNALGPIGESLGFVWGDDGNAQ